MAANRETANPTGDQNGLHLSNTGSASPGISAPTLENVQQILVTYAKSQESQLQEAKREVLELQRSRAEWLMEKRSLNGQIKTLEEKLKGLQADLQSCPVGGAPNTGVSTDAAGDADQDLLETLRKENAILKEQLRNLKSCSAGRESPDVQSIQDSLESTRLGGEHPESCPSPMQSSSGRPRELAGSSMASGDVETDGRVPDQPNTHLETEAGRFDTPPARMTTTAGNRAGINATVEAAKLSQSAALEKLQSGTSSASGDSSNIKVIEGAITTDMMTWLSENVSRADFKPLMRKLGLTDTNLENIMDGHLSIVEQRYQGFRYWKKTYSTTATVPTLLVALRAKSLHQLCRDFCKEFPERSTPSEIKRQPTLEADCSPSERFSSDLEKFMIPFLDKCGYGVFVEDLHNFKISAEQSLKLGYRTQEGNVHADQVLVHWSSAYFRGNSPDSTFKKCQALWSILPMCGPKIREVFKKHANQGGVIGPAMDRDTKIENLPYSIIKEIEELLSLDDGVCNWKDLLEWLKKRHSSVFARVDKNKIRMWEGDRDQHKGAKSVLSIWETTTQAKVGILYEWLVENGRLDIAKVIE